MDKPVWLWRQINDILTWKSDAREVLTGFREAVKYKLKARYVDRNGRYIVLDVLIDNNPVILVNYNAPNVESEQLKFWTNCLTFSINYKLQKIIRLSGVGISICFLTSIWTQKEAPLSSKLSHFPSFFLWCLKMTSAIYIGSETQKRNVSCGAENHRSSKGD